MAWEMRSKESNGRPNDNGFFYATLETLWHRRFAFMHHRYRLSTQSYPSNSLPQLSLADQQLSPGPSAFWPDLPSPSQSPSTLHHRQIACLAQLSGLGMSRVMRGAALHYATSRNGMSDRDSNAIEALSVERSPFRMQISSSHTSGSSGPFLLLVR